MAIILLSPLWIVIFFLAFGDYFTNMRGLFDGICPFLKRQGSVQFFSSDMKIIADVQMQT